MTLRIYYSPSSDPLITESLSGFAVLWSKVDKFLRFEEGQLSIEASTSESAEPYDKLLPKLRFIKGDGPIKVSCSVDEGVSVKGARRYGRGA